MIANRFSCILKIFIFAIFPVYASDFNWKLYVAVGPASSKNLSYNLPEDSFNVPSVNGLKLNCKVTRIDAGERDLICVDEKTGQKSFT